MVTQKNDDDAINADFLFEFVVYFLTHEKHVMFFAIKRINSFKHSGLFSTSIVLLITCLSCCFYLHDLAVSNNLTFMPHSSRGPHLAVHNLNNVFFIHERHVNQLR